MEVAEEKKLGKVGTWGGKREGGGRKRMKKTAKQFEARADLYKWIDSQWGYIKNVLEAVVEKEDKDMIKYLIDQRIGKASQHTSTDLTSGGKPIPLLALLDVQHNNSDQENSTDVKKD